MRDLASAARVSTLVGLQTRLDPAVRLARQMIAENVIGRIVSVSAEQIARLQIVCDPNRAWMASCRATNRIGISGDQDRKVTRGSC